jgi:hypothetical protein
MLLTEARCLSDKLRIYEPRVRKATTALVSISENAASGKCESSHVYEVKDQ